MDRKCGMKAFDHSSYKMVIIFAHNDYVQNITKVGIQPPFFCGKYWELGIWFFLMKMHIMFVFFHICLFFFQSSI